MKNPKCSYCGKAVKSKDLGSWDLATGETFHKQCS